MISSIVLAAGQSTRMGEAKSLLEWRGERLICYQVNQLRAAGIDEVIVVLGHRADEIHRAMHDVSCRVVLNPRYHAGRAGSLRIGAKAVNRDAEAILVVNVDQPRRAEFFQELVAAHTSEAAATRPLFEGRHGHPVVVAGRLREEMMGARDETGGLHGVLAAHEAELCDWPSGADCEVDFNTPDEYEGARRLFGTPA